ncbi:MAG TPA: ABC transporter ATP-binding protein [Bryobacteraceae bacterium]|nr:ABC transporter ATP-binding protein [Bryobacteraceae bacterium]
MSTELICRCAKRFRSGFGIDAELQIPMDRSPVTILFGPSGSGKTSVLRLLAGLERPDTGLIAFRGRDWFDAGRGIDLPPQQRRAAFLFQDYALFPHLTVAANVAYAARPERSRELLKAFGLADLATRKPRAISGGQQQRVALARALASDPALLLLDEPLSALDAPTRTWMRYELRRMLQTGRVPALVVTHDRMEALALGDWMSVIVDGRIRQTGPIQEIFRKPADAQVAASVGVENVLPARIVAQADGLVTIQVGTSTLQSADSGAVPSQAAAIPVYACIRAEDVTLTSEPPHASSARNRIAGRVLLVSPEGPLARVELDCGFPLMAVITAQSANELQLRPEDHVSAMIKATAVHLTMGAGT